MTKKSTVLIVDDILVNRILLEGLIESFGYQTVLAGNGSDALSIIKNNPPDLILLDVIMPSMNGYELLEYLKSDFHLKSIPVILISAMDHMDDIVKGIELGIAGLDAAELTRAGFHAGKAGFQTAKTVKTFRRDIPKQEKPWGQSSTFLGGVAAASLAASIVHKMGAKNLKKLRLQCDREKGKAKTVCYNKVRRDAIRTEIVSLSSMKIKFLKTKDSEKCIKKIEQRIKELQNRMDSIKVF